MMYVVYSLFLSEIAIDLLSCATGRPANSQR
jgi:hypothetical protein